MRRAMLRLVGLVAVTGLSACAGSYSVDPPLGPVLRVGAPMALTGSLATDGLATQQGYEYCQDVINAHGGVLVGQRHLHLLISYQDDQSSPTRSAQIAAQFNDAGIKLLLGPYSSEANATVAAITQTTGQLMIDTAGADNKIFSHGYHQVFGIESPASDYAASVIDAIRSSIRPVPRTLVVVSADDNFSLEVAHSAIHDAIAKGIRTLPLITFPAGSTDLSAVVTELRAEHPDLVLESGHFVEGSAFILQAAQLGLRTRGIAETVAPTDPQFVQALGALANGVISPTQWTPAWSGQDPYFGTAADYARGFRARFGFTPDYHNAEASAGCLALVLAIEHAASISPGKVAASLRRLDVSSFFGQIHFAADGQDTSRRMAVIQIQHERPVTVWPPDLAQAPLSWPATSAP